MLRKDVRPEDARILRNAWLIPAGPDRAATSEGRHGSSGKSSNTRSGSPSRSRSSSGSPSGAFLHLLGSHLVAAGSFRGTPVVPTGCLPLSVSGRIGFLSQIWIPAERMVWFSSSCCCGEGGSDLHVQWPPPRSAMLGGTRQGRPTKFSLPPAEIWFWGTSARVVLNDHNLHFL